ncbi:hypothetical protein Poly51_03770 [Rubripirellula tenax]|uniref:Uncharacterized protein n=1 Tax=Rubripirellula tenax TaxID=2528015 RepID=A0A5C6FHS5_9BACT|nr:hypothetical protein [Rubripirellula tenax]TWU60103.1 hypothetical protein Poly51_03770 [Rubripirellula tenax]
MTINMNSSGKRFSRTGLSIMEVLFAIGVLLIGILGLASVIPVGANQSSDAVKFDKSSVAVQNLIDETVARVEAGTRSGFLSPNTATTADRQSYFNVNVTRTMLRNGFCVDPYFLTAADNRFDFTATQPGGTPHDRSLFPCFTPLFNPLTSPNGPGTTNANQRWFNTNATGILGGPRMPRVAIGHSGFSYRPTGSAVTINVPTSPKYLIERDRASQSSDPSLVIAEDDTLDAGRFYAKDSAGNLIKDLDSGRFSAMSFVKSDAFDATNVRITTVVFDRRELLTNPGAHDYTEPAPNTPLDGEASFDMRQFTFDYRDRPYYLGEQLLYVSGVDSGNSFAEGLGGTVEVVTHRAIVPTGDIEQDPPGFKRGQLLMLIRNQYLPYQTTALASLTPTPPQQLNFAWFEIVEVRKEPEAVNIPDPVHTTVNRDVWRTQLELKGPPWIFDDSARQNSGNVTPDFTIVADDTFAVYMPQAVAVFDRTITVNLE